MKLKRTMKMKKNCDYVSYGKYRSVRTGYIIMKANELAKKHDVEIVDFGEDIWVFEGIYIKTKAKKKDYKAFAKELVEDLGYHLEGYKI